MKYVRLQLSLCNHNPDVHQLQHVLELTYINLEARKKIIPAPKPYRNQGGVAQPIDKGRQGGSGQAGANHIEVPKPTKDVHAETGRPVQTCTYCKEVGHLKNWCCTSGSGGVIPNRSKRNCRRIPIWVPGPPRAPIYKMGENRKRPHFPISAFGAPSRVQSAVEQKSESATNFLITVRRGERNSYVSQATLNYITGYR
jgi:hypothetical protein